MQKGGLYLALGDSVTWAGGYSSMTKGDDFYVNRIAKTIATNKKAIKVVNKGIGGATSASLVRNLQWACRFTPDIVTIGIGMNDANNQVVSTANYETNLKAVIDFLRRKNPNVEIILCTPNQTTDASRSPYIAAYRTSMETVASTYPKGVKVCRFENAWLSGETATYSGDGVHPNASGHAKIHDLLWTVLQTTDFIKNL